MASLWTTVGRAATLRFVRLQWRPAVFAAIGVLAGTGLFVLHISRAASYLGDDSETCMNCHVMTTQYVTWQHGSHARAADCNDCHVPHTSLPAHYAFKAKDGLWHATVFTMRWEPQVIRLSAGAVPVVEENCRRCHQETIAGVAAAEHGRGDLRCWDCHRETPHGSVRSLSATPGVFQPRLPPVSDLMQQPTIGERPKTTVTDIKGDRRP
jgi:cytochrome c nitrite reductase small subunit